MRLIAADLDERCQLALHSSSWECPAAHRCRSGSVLPGCAAQLILDLTNVRRRSTAASSSSGSGTCSSCRWRSAAFLPPLPRISRTRLPQARLATFYHGAKRACRMLREVHSLMQSGCTHSSPQIMQRAMQPLRGWCKLSLPKLWCRRGGGGGPPVVPHPRQRLHARAAHARQLCRRPHGTFLSSLRRSDAFFLACRVLKRKKAVTFNSH